MRVFPKDMMNYEKVFTAPRYTSYFRMDRMEKPYGFKDINEYKVFFREFLIKKSTKLWYDILETEWLINNFDYKGRVYNKRKNTYIDVPKPLNVTFGVFTKEFIGIGTSFLTTNFYFKRIISYFKEIYPDFYKGNPFNNPEQYVFPFKNITIDYLVTVYQMPERLDILRYADEHEMTFSVFLDFILNYIGKYNDMEDKEVFRFTKYQHYPMYVKDMRIKSKYGNKQ